MMFTPEVGRRRYSVLSPLARSTSVPLAELDFATFHRSVCRADHDTVGSLTVAVAPDIAIRDGLVSRRIALYEEEAAYIRAEHTQRNHRLGSFQRVVLLKLDIRKIPSVPFSASAFPYGQGNRVRRLQVEAQGDSICPIQLLDVERFAASHTEQGDGGAYLVVDQ
mgnify:CR=1 FL=1